MTNTPRNYKRGHPALLLVTTIIALILSSLPMSAPAAAEWYNTNRINATEYKQQYGHWDVLDIPKEFRSNTIHAALLPTGKVLLVAGSGNQRKVFNQYHEEGMISVLSTVLYDPKTNSFQRISTPSDLFCSGHASLQSGSLLIAGGTSGYELLKNEVKKPAGSITIHDENPHDPVRIFKKGTKFTAPNGKVYVSTQEVKLQPAMKMDHGNGHVMIEHSSTKVFVEAVDADASYVTSTSQHYNIEGLTGVDAQNVYGQGGPMTLNKQDYRGDDKAYEFDPIKEQYVRVGDLKESRWYASLPVLNNGEVLAVSGLDNSGNITQTSELYSPESKEWRWGPTHAFPTYPALFRTQDPAVLFFAGSSAGYGPEKIGREPGFWNITNNTFQPVNGLRDPDLLETSGSVALPPAKGSNDGSQSSRIMVAGGGGVGESPRSTARTDIIDIAKQNPKFVPGPDLPEKLRYINLTVTPWDEVFATGGSSDYRAKGNSYSYKAFSFNPTTGRLNTMADELVGRSYHSGSLLLPDGRILVFGNDPLFSDKKNTAPSTFEQRIEIFTPPQFYKAARPALEGPDNLEVHAGDTLTYSSKDAASIRNVRLIPPSSTTHVTNVEQRSVGVVVTKGTDGQLNVQLPKDSNVLPPGWYMMFVVTDNDMPSTAKMIKVVR